MSFARNTISTIAFILSLCSPAIQHAHALDGICGDADGGTFSFAPPQDMLCASGTDNSSLSGTGPWTWSCFGSDGGAAVACSADYVPPARLRITFAGDGSGSVTGMTGSDMACISSDTDCSAAFSYGDLVTVSATPDAVSTFSIWSGACGTRNDICTVVMDSDKDIIATFLSSHRARIGNDYFATVGSAFARSVSGDTVEAWGTTFFENVLLTSGQTVKLHGGYDELYSSQTGYTVIDGSLKIRSGRLTVHRVKVR